MRYGTMMYNNEDNRLDMQSDDGSLLGGFHCGDHLDILLDDGWTPTRVEYDEDWYLVGLYQSGKIPVGLNVRVCA